MSGIKKRRLRMVVSILLIAVSVSSIGYYVYRTVSDNAMFVEGRELYESLADQLFAEPDSPSAEPQVSVPPESRPSTDTQAVTDTSESAEAAETAPETDSAPETAQYAPRVDFSSLRAGQYDNLVAWIRSAGTKIDYPVMRGDDNDYYLTHLADGTPNKVGSIYMDFRNAADFSNRHTIIYGHHIKNGQMFGSLDGYTQQSYYNAHQTMELYTRDGGDYTIEIFAGYVVNAEVETLPLRFRSTEEYEQYITDVQARSVFSSSVEVSGDDRIVSLCTCTYSSKNARFILVGKLVGG